MTVSNRCVEASTHSSVDRFLSEREARVASGIRSRSTLRSMIIEGLFPRPIHISRGRVAWSEAEIAAWQRARIQERDDRLNAGRNDQVVLCRSRK
jgi:predicted DNA-binding transcriptional regulator AlpA